MKVIRYTVHFAYLAVAATILIIVAPLSTPVWVDRFTFYFALDGLLHAVALVLALNVRGAYLRRFSFAVITAVVSAGVPIFGLSLSRLTGLDGTPALLSALAMGSAGGASVYWALVRLFWIRGLTASSLFRTVGLCVGATIISFTLAVVVTQRGKSPSTFADAIPTIGWWIAFSLSLYFAERSGATANQRLGGIDISPRK